LEGLQKKKKKDIDAGKKKKRKLLLSGNVEEIGVTRAKLRKKRTLGKNWTPHGWTNPQKKKKTQKKNQAGDALREGGWCRKTYKGRNATPQAVNSA